MGRLNGNLRRLIGKYEQVSLVFIGSILIESKGTGELVWVDIDREVVNVICIDDVDVD